MYNIYNGTVINLKFAAVILAGGKSRRMGKNKAWLPLGGRRVIDVIAERMTGFEEVFVSLRYTAGGERLHKHRGYP